MEDIEKYFDHDKWNSMGSYERQRYSNIYKNYLEMRTLDLDIPKPDFLEEYELKQTSKNKKQGGKKNLRKDSKIASAEEYDKLLDVHKEIGDKGFSLEEIKFSKKKFVTISDLIKELQINFNKMVKHCEKTHHIYILETLRDVKQSEKLETTPPSRNKRYPKRNIKKVDYTEEDIPDDYYIYCDRCGREWEGCFCPFHGPLLNCIDSKVPKDETNSMRAMQTVPIDYLCIRQSAIPNAGMGVWTIKCIPVGVRFGPYEGIECDNGNDEGYCWQIRKDGRVHHFVDGKEQGVSNWMRYVNCSRNIVEQNLMAFQYLGKIYYRTIRNIYPHTELLVWYGDEYGKRLGIDTKDYYKPIDKKVLSANNFPCMGCHLNFSTPVFMELHRKRCSKFRTAVYNHRMDLEGQTKKQEEAVDNIKTETKQKNKCDKYGKIMSLENHNNLSDVSDINKKLFKCDKCDYTTKLKANLKIHINGVHLKLKSFKCTECSATFINSGHLKTHINAVHLNLKPFKCTECDATFTRNDHLKIHINAVHLHLKPFKCTECSATFTQSSSLKTHINNMHNKK